MSKYVIKYKPLERERPFSGDYADHPMFGMVKLTWWDDQYKVWRAIDPATGDPIQFIGTSHIQLLEPWVCSYDVDQKNPPELPYVAVCPVSIENPYIANDVELEENEVHFMAQLPWGYDDWVEECEGMFAKVAFINRNST